MQDNDSYIYRRGVTPETRVVVSQKNKIYSVAYDQASFSQIGLMSSFSWSDSKGANPVRGIGFGDQIAEVVPGLTEMISVSVERNLMYLSNAHQVFGYSAGVDGLVRSLKHHRWPFDVKQELVFSRIATEASVPKQVSPASDGVNEALLTFFEACWMTSYDPGSLAADGAEISESVSFAVTDIIDGTSTYGENLSTGNNPFEDVSGGSIRFGSGTSTPIF